MNLEEFFAEFLALPLKPGDFADLRVDRATRDRLFPAPQPLQDAEDKLIESAFRSQGFEGKRKDQLTQALDFADKNRIDLIADEVECMLENLWVFRRLIAQEISASTAVVRLVSWKCHARQGSGQVHADEAVCWEQATYRADSGIAAPRGRDRLRALVADHHLSTCCSAPARMLEIFQREAPVVLNPLL